MDRVSTDLSEIQSFLQSILAEERIQNLRGEEESANLKWCEIPFVSISPDNSPYRYSFFGIWYKAEWNFAPARLCVAIGGIHREKIHSFRQVSASVQYELVLALLSPYSSYSLGSPSSVA